MPLRRRTTQQALARENRLAIPLRRAGCLSLEWILQESLACWLCLRGIGTERFPSRQRAASQVPLVVFPAVSLEGEPEEPERAEMQARGLAPDKAEEAAAVRVQRAN